jgi:hypothetical protein
MPEYRGRTGDEGEGFVRNRRAKGFSPDLDTNRQPISEWIVGRCPEGLLGQDPAVP